MGCDRRLALYIGSVTPVVALAVSDYQHVDPLVGVGRSALGERHCL